MAVTGAAIELAMVHQIENDKSIVAEPYYLGRAGKLMNAAKAAPPRAPADGGGRAHPGRADCVRDASRGRLSAHPPRRLRHRHGKREGPGVHGDPAAGAHGEPGRWACPDDQSLTSSAPAGSGPGGQMRRCRPTAVSYRSTLRVALQRGTQDE
jgi:hypothetical protein